jgi:hypothetical protein
MRPQAKTIQIFLPDGNARGIRIADITSETVHAIQVPRSQIKDAKQRKEVHQVGTYFLFGEQSETGITPAYIGEAENCFERIVQHDSKKPFWTTAIIATSKTLSFTKTHAKYIEWFALTEAQKVKGRFSLEQIMPSKPYVSEPMEADLLNSFETIKVLLSTLGYPILETVEQPKMAKDFLYCTRSGASAKGEYINNEFVVFKGSVAKPLANNISDNPKRVWLVNFRKKLEEDRVISKHGAEFIFEKDYVFNTPSTAAAMIIGMSANGWVEWKDKNGKTLDELKRQ